MSGLETVVVAHSGARMKRAFYYWGKANEWNDKVDGNYQLTEVLVVDE